MLFMILTLDIYEYYLLNSEVNNKLTEMKTFHIDDFTCTLCANLFCPPFNLPYLLPCTHSICGNCLQKSLPQGRIICPEDLEACPLQGISINQTTKRALERLMKEHKNYNESTQLECIKSLAASFDEIIISKQKQIQNLQGLFDQIYLSEIQRIKGIHERVKRQINRPSLIVEDWKEIVSLCLTSIKKNRNLETREHMTQLNHYIEEGRKIKIEINDFYALNFQEMANKVIRTPNMCFQNNFTINFESLFRKNNETQNQKLKEYVKNSKRNYEESEENLMYSSPKLLPFDNNENTYRKGSQAKIQKVHTNQNNHNIEDSTIKFTEMSALKNQKNIQQQQPLANINFASYLNTSEPEICHSLTNREKSASKNNSLSGSRRFMNEDGEFSLSHFQFESNMNDISNYISENMKPERESNLAPSQRPKEKLHEIPMAKNIQNQEKEKGNELEKGNNKKKEAIYKKTKNPFNYMSPEPVIRQQHTEECEETVELEMMVKGDDNMGGNMGVNMNEHMNGDEMLLDEEELKSSWAVGRNNFLKEWEIKKEKKGEELQVKQKGFYNCEKEKNSYMSKMQLVRAQEAFKVTQVGDNSIEVINESLQGVDMNLYLQNFRWQDPKNPIEIVKFVRTGLSDDQLNVLLNYLVKSRVTALVLSCNNLTDISLDAFLYFVEANNRLKNVYLPKNYINILRSKSKINLLREKGINIYI